MSEIKVGDTVRHYNWTKGQYALVTAVGHKTFLGTTPDICDSQEVQYILSELGWEHFVEPIVFPERWINIYVHGSSVGWPTRNEAYQNKMGLTPIGVLHLKTDGTTEMEMVAV